MAQQFLESDLLKMKSMNRLAAVILLAMNRIHIVGITALIAIQCGAAPVTVERLNALRADEQVAWRDYLKRSAKDAQADADSIQSEVTASKMTNAIKAPSGGDFKLSYKPGDAWFAGDEAAQLVPVILSYQTPTGGWSKHTGYAKGARQPGMLFSSQYEPGKPPHYLATFDNGSTTEQLHFLANVWHATKRDDCKVGFVKGLNFILAAQYPNGGWPQVYPLEGGYHDDITFNDDAMTHILELLHAIASGEPQFGFLDAEMRGRVRTALNAGIGCLLKTQIVQNGNKTGWCSQFDAITLQPSSARKMEPATLGGTETAHIVKFLMTLTNPTPEIVTSVEAGLKWLDAVRVTGEIRTNEAGKKYFAASATGAEIRWARFYDLTTGKPVFPGRDGITYATFEAMAAKNKLGYDYFSSQPGSILNNGQKKWRKMLASHAKKK